MFALESIPDPFVRQAPQSEAALATVATSSGISIEAVTLSPSPSVYSTFSAAGCQ